MQSLSKRQRSFIHPNQYQLNMDGVNEYVNVGNEAPLNFERTDPFSFSAWIYPTNIATRVIFSKMQTTSLGYVWFIVSGTGGCRMRMLNGAQEINVRLSTTLVANTQYHIVMTYDG